jgi:hypothetical protein
MSFSVCCFRFATLRKREYIQINLQTLLIMSFTSYFFENLLVLLSRTFFSFCHTNLLKIHVPRIRRIELHILLVISEYDRLHQRLE